MADTTLPGLLDTGTHAARPAANAVGSGALYSCTDHSLVYQSDGSSWTTWANLAGTGSVATDTIWDAAGDLVQGTGANTAAKLTLGAAGTVVRSTGATNAYAFPPGYEFDYAQITTGVNVTATVEASADTIVTGAAVSYDGSTVIIVEFFTPQARPRNATAAGNLLVWLFDGSTSLGRIGFLQNVSTGTDIHPMFCTRRLTPSAGSHTYSIRATVDAITGNVGAGAGGAGNVMPAYIRQIKV